MQIMIKNRICVAKLSVLTVGARIGAVVRIVPSLDDQREGALQYNKKVKRKLVNC